MRGVAALALAGTLLLAAGCGGAKTTTVTVTSTVVHTVTRSAAPVAASPCTSSALRASFAVEPGSAGAGNIVYKLTLANSSSSSCSLTGVPGLQLYDKSGNALPTHAAAEAGSSFPAVTLGPGTSIAYDARFSPDVTGVGDNPGNPCQPVATTLRVSAPGGGSVDAQVEPPTSVCSRGTMTLRPSH